jgi:protocatechuate 3,4-dioxygenase beta subunit
MTVSRRVFLAAAIPSGVLSRTNGFDAQGLEQFAMSAPPCGDDPRSTPQVPRDATFRAGAPARTSLVEPGMAGTRLRVSGTVTGLSCGRVPGARVDLWQADDRGIYDMAGYRLRGHQLTDATGGFRFDTIVPGAAQGRARRLGIRVIVANKGDFATELFFPDDPRNVRDPRFKPELLLKMVRATTGQAATFDLVLAI